MVAVSVGIHAIKDSRVLILGCLQEEGGDEVAFLAFLSGL